MPILGLDIGGASLKAATDVGWTTSERFALWREPANLSGALKKLVASASFDRVAVTMTGELCDAFITKEDGVKHILVAVRTATRGASVHVWSTHARFMTVQEALADPWGVAASNWLASATIAARSRTDPSLFIDIGSTTTDVMLLQEGRPQPMGRTDPDRLASGELVYQGVRRTPLCALLQDVVIDGVTYSLMNELFATSLDAYLVLGRIAEDETSSETADGRPETMARSINRLAKMIGSDETRFTIKQAEQLSNAVCDAQARSMAKGVKRVLDRFPDAQVESLVVCGEGEFLAPLVQSRVPALKNAAIKSWSEEMSPALSRAACAYAVARLLADDL